jgi:hypothetical protein
LGLKIDHYIVCDSCDITCSSITISISITITIPIITSPLNHHHHSDHHLIIPQSYHPFLCLSFDLNEPFDSEANLIDYFAVDNAVESVDNYLDQVV